MITLLRDLYTHQAWADGRVWVAVLDHPAARQDADLKARLAHLHGAQHLWLARWKGLDATLPTAADFPDLARLHAFAGEVHLRLRGWVEAASEPDLARPLVYRDLQGRTWEQPLGGLMLHVPLHSQHHRGQVALRLKALGVPVPPTDFVVWLREGRPEG